MLSKPQLVCLGEILVDMFPAEIGRKLAEVSAFHPKPGGAPANVAVAAARLDTPSAFIGKVGEDAFGYHLMKVLGEQGVETRGMRLDERARTTLAFIAMPDENTSEYVFYRNPGADLCLRDDELDHDLLESARALHIGSLSLVDEPARSATFSAVRLAAGAGALISLDVNYRPSLWRSPDEAVDRIQTMIPLANLLKVNEAELKLLAKREELKPACGSLLEIGPELVVVTLGRRGSYFQTRDAHGFVPAFPVKTVDATGCGDSFIAGLLSRLVRHSDWREALTQSELETNLRFANAVGALTSMTQGVIPALPNILQVEQFLEKYPT